VTRQLVLLLMAVLFVTTLLVEANLQSEVGMEIVRAEWAYEVRGEGDYDPNPSGVFRRGTRAYAYIEVEGFALGTAADDPLVDLRVDVALRTRTGVKLYSQAEVVEYTLKQPASPPELVWFYIWVDIPRWAPRATYKAEVIVRDLVAAEAISLQREITVE
jgi:hypothetical protein